MSVKSDYKSRTMAELADEAVEIVREFPGASCGLIGERLFQGAIFTSNCSAPYARIAGKVMKYLERQKRARWMVPRGSTKGGWFA